MGNEPKYCSFEDMPVWKLAYDFAIQIYNITGGYPKEEKYGLTSDTRRSAVSIAANIAEAFGRFHFKDKLNFYFNSRGSTTESISHLKIALGLGFLDEDKYRSVEGKASGIWEELNKIISSINRSTS